MKNITSFFLVCCVLVIAGAQDSKMKWRQNVLQPCLQQFKVEESAYKSGTVPDDKKCVYKCVLEKRDLMNSKGDITISEYKAKHQNSSVRKLNDLEACVTPSKKTDACDTAKAFSECVRSKRKN